jgi:hypothetical protein
MEKTHYRNYTKQKNPAFDVDLNMVKEFSKKYEQFRQLRHLHQDVDIFAEHRNDKSLSSIRDLDNEEDWGVEDKVVEDEEEEFYISHKRNKIKSKFVPDFHYNPSSTKNIKFPGWRHNKPQKINTVIENYQKREKTYFPAIKSTPRAYSKSNDFIGLNGNVHTAIKKKLKIMSIFVLKEQGNNNLAQADLDDEKSIIDYENVAKMNALQQNNKAELVRSKSRLPTLLDANTSQSNPNKLKHMGSIKYLD